MGLNRKKQVKIGKIGERGLALEGEMDHTRKSCWIIYIENYVGSYAMKEMPSTKEMINQINLDKDVTIQQYKILSVPNN